jgi:hypothetical protein
MAKAKDLAALAGLAGLAYAYNKSKDKGTTDSNPTRAARPESTETREDKVADEGYKNDVLKTITQKREGSNDQAGNQGVLPPKSLTPEVKPKKPASKLETFTTRKDPREAEAGMSRGTRTTSVAGAGRGVVNPPSVTPATSTASSSEDGMENYKPRRPAVVSSSEDGMKNYKPRRPVPPLRPTGMKKGGMTASSRADGIATKGKTRGKIC